MSHDIHVTTQILGNGATEEQFRLPANAPLLEVLQEGAGRAGAALLPDRDHPLDRLHNLRPVDGVGPVIDDLTQPVGPYIKEKNTSRDFGIELVRAIRVNTRWAVAGQAEMTPRQILELPGIELDPTSYTLYLPGSAEPLPPDTPVPLTRGTALEAQRDGKYGGR